eukprot:COSAG02_NODE_42738_length_381_cov_1.627660_1_plen_27_part_10
MPPVTAATYRTISQYSTERACASLPVG